MSWWQAAIVGVVRQLMDLLPASTSGSPVRTERLQGTVLPGVALEVAPHKAVFLSMEILGVERAIDSDHDRPSPRWRSRRGHAC